MKTRWALLLAALSVTCSPPDLGDPPVSTGPTPPGRPATVTRVIDGDTIEAELDGTIVDIRLIGIDTPETVHPSEPVECFGAASSRFTTTMLDGHEIRLEFDVERTDQYGRTLAYIWLGDELFNEVLLRQGFAQVSTYPPNVKYVDDFIAAQREARFAGRGLWGGCQKPEVNIGGGGGDCDPSYPDVCVPSYPPDLDCGEIPFTNIRVTGSDSHGLDDEDPDKVGCET